MEFPEEPARPARDPRMPEGSGTARSRAEHEVEVWLRRELAFLYGVERRIRRRARLRKEAWRAIAVAAILALFALCWYIAALGSHAFAAVDNACSAKSSTSVSSTAHTTTSSASKSGSCAS